MAIIDETADATAEELAYQEWRQTHRVDDRRPAARAAAQARVSSARAEVERRFQEDWGIVLPESIFVFWEFLLTLGPLERRAMDDIELEPFGIMDLFEDPARPIRDGLDVRVHGRYYRDPPEFLTFMHGGSDGLHFGLWFDDGRTFTGVTSYYNNDGIDLEPPGGTPLDAVLDVIDKERDLIEYELDDDEDDLDDLDDDDDEDDDFSEDSQGEGFADTAVERSRRLRLLYEMVLMFEPDDEPVDAASGSHSFPERVPTLDGAGALAPPGTTAVAERLAQGEGPQWMASWRKELTSDPGVLDAYVTHAQERCVVGDPGHALALGRDLHWISAGEQAREQLAYDLLMLAYRALGYDNLASIAAAHHRHRDRTSVDVLAWQ